jgi:hypothetical protein
MKFDFKQFICKLFGHKFEFSGGIPSMGLYRKCECKRCGKKWRADYTVNLITEQDKIWKEVEEF